MRETKRRLGMALVLFVVVTGFYWKLTLTRQFDWMLLPDLSSQVLPWFEEQARIWGKGTIALWDPYMWAGQPLLGQAQPGTAYPLNWILFALPLRRDGLIHWSALQWYFVVIRLMGVAFCYLLCRDLGRSRIASLLAGVVFGLGGFVGNTVWPQWVNGAVWLPLVFLFLLRASHGRNVLGNAALSGMFLGISWLSGHHQAPLFLSVAASGAWLYLIFRSGRWDWRFAKAAAVALLFTGMTGALQILPAYEYGRLAKRWVTAPQAITWNQPVPYSVHETYAMKPFSLPGIVFPDVKTDTDPFVGTAALALGLIGLSAGWRDTRVRLLAAVGLGGLVYSLGGHSVFQGFLYGIIPELDKAREVAAAILLFEFGAAVLAAFGLDQLGSREPSPWSKRVMWGVLTLGLFTLALFETIYFANKWSFTGPDSVMLTPFFAMGCATLLFGMTRGSLSRMQGGVLLVLLVLLELGNNADSVIRPRADTAAMKWLNQSRGNGDIAEFLRKQPNFPRVNVEGDAFLENWGAYHDVEMWGGYLASLTANLQRFDFWAFPAHMLWGVGFTIAAKPPEGGGQEVFAGSSGLKVYRHPEVFPRAWAVHELVQAPNAQVGNRMILERYADFHRMAFLLGPAPALESCGAPDEVALEQHTPNSVSIRAEMACQGMVVLSDTFFPGWHAAIDGQPAAIYEVNEAMRGVIVPKGAHTVTYRYHPRSVLWGALLTLSGISGAITLAACSKRTPGRQPYHAYAIRATDGQGAPRLAADRPLSGV
jgi:Bacterial membrane protein YfhO